MWFIHKLFLYNFVLVYIAPTTDSEVISSKYKPPKYFNIQNLVHDLTNIKKQNELKRYKNILNRILPKNEDKHYFLEGNLNARRIYSSNDDQVERKNKSPVVAVYVVNNENDDRKYSKITRSEETSEEGLEIEYKKELWGTPFTQGRSQPLQILSKKKLRENVHKINNSKKPSSGNQAEKLAAALNIKIDASKNITEELLRSWSSSCNKKASKACRKACKQAYKAVCSDYKCSKSMKKDFKRECKRVCEENFEGE